MKKLFFAVMLTPVLLLGCTGTTTEEVTEESVAPAVEEPAAPAVEEPAAPAAEDEEA